MPLIAFLIALPLIIFGMQPEKSQCFGQTNKGALQYGDRPDFFGPNYGSYCHICVLALRTFGHAPVIRTLEAAYARLEKSHPETYFLYGEIGFPWGGRFPPHRTHRNGLSVDFMVPLKDGLILPSHMGNRFGYDVSFDDQGRMIGDEASYLYARHNKVAKIDFEATAIHLLALEAEARKRGGRIARVFFAPGLQKILRKTSQGKTLFQKIAFNKRPSWVRHDDHYHVDFSFPCTPKR